MTRDPGADRNAQRPTFVHQCPAAAATATAAAAPRRTRCFTPRPSICTPHQPALQVPAAMEPEPLLPPAPPLRPAPPAWRRLVQQHWLQYIAVAAVWLLMKWVDPIEPRSRAIYHGSDAEYWQARAAGATDACVEGFKSRLACIAHGANQWYHNRLCCEAEGSSPQTVHLSTPLLLTLQYTYPFLEDTVPLWAVPVLTLILPLAVFVAAYLVRGSSRWDVVRFRNMLPLASAAAAAKVSPCAAAAPPLQRCPRTVLPTPAYLRRPCPPGGLGIPGGGASRLPQFDGLRVYHRAGRQHPQVTGEAAATNFDRLALPNPALQAPGGGKVCLRTRLGCCLPRPSAFRQNPSTHSPCPPQVARPRPDFIARCFPSTLTPVWGDDGMPQCEASVPHQVIKTGMRSFPSGAWALAGGLANTSHSEPALRHERPTQRKCDRRTHPAPYARSACRMERRRPGLPVPVAAGHAALLCRRYSAPGASGGQPAAAGCRGMDWRYSRAEQQVSLACCRYVENVGRCGMPRPHIAVQA